MFWHMHLINRIPCYSVLAFQTAYLKANYPSEYMASVLTHNLNDITSYLLLRKCKTIRDLNSWA